MNQYDVKLIYLQLYDRRYTFFELQQELFLDNTPQMHRCLRYLAENKLIYTHPLLLKRKPRGKDFLKLRSVNLEVMDRSYSALCWALDIDSDSIVKGKSREYYINQLHKLASFSREEVYKQESFRELSVEFLQDGNGLLVSREPPVLKSICRS